MYLIDYHNFGALRYIVGQTFRIESTDLIKGRPIDELKIR